MNAPEDNSIDNAPEEQDDEQQGIQGRRSDTQEDDGLIGQTDVPDTEGWNEATEASSASFTLEPEKGIESEVKKDDFDDSDYNGKQ